MAQTRNLLYVTSNQSKYDEACLVLSEFALERIDLELPELQGEAREIVNEKAKAAYARVGRPLVVEDVAVYCPALSGLPGPYVKDFLKRMGEEGLYRLVHKLGDTRAEVACCVAYITADLQPVVFEGRLSGTLVEPQGGSRFGKYSWNPIFMPQGHTRTFGAMSMQEQSEISMRKRALEQLRAYLKAHS
jgi:inosine triphosphate pyrophosphatase